MMNLSVGIVGLPNVGKSTLFNALLKKQQALAAKYPFATIDPNIGVVPVPDERLEVLAIATREAEKLAETPPIVPASVKFVDIAGLVRGASEGEGLGNKFLSHIREVSVIAHVVRVFEDDAVLREGAVDPESDYDVIRAELMLADLQSVENHELKIKDHKEKNVLRKIIEVLRKGIPVSDMDLTYEEGEVVQSLNLLTIKPEIIVLNVSEELYQYASLVDVLHKYAEMLSKKPSEMVVICAKVEEELASLRGPEQKEYLNDLGFGESGLSRLIRVAYEKLGLISFLTAGEREVRAWTVPIVTPAPRAAGVIHTDFEKNFIKAEVVGIDDFVEQGGWKGARAKGLVRVEGRDYVMQEGDVVEFKVGR